MSTLKAIELGKENTVQGLLKKDKNQEETSIKKIALGETSQPKIGYADEPTSPEDTKLMDRKRQMGKKANGEVSLKLNFC